MLVNLRCLRYSSANPETLWTSKRVCMCPRPTRGWYHGHMVLLTFTIIWKETTIVCFVALFSCSRIQLQQNGWDVSYDALAVVNKEQGVIILWLALAKRQHGRRSYSESTENMNKDHRKLLETVKKITAGMWLHDNRGYMRTLQHMYLQIAQY
jgi:hypothetical protein